MIPAYITDRVRIDGDCWIWTGPLSSRGAQPSSFPKALHGTRSIRRAVYEAVNGPLSRRMVVAVTCDDALCVHPLHITAVRMGKQQLVARARGVIFHDAAWRAKITVSRRKGSRLSMVIARSIRARVAAGEKQSDIAAELELSRSHVNKIVKGECWAECGPLALIAQQAGWIP